MDQIVPIHVYMISVGCIGCWLWGMLAGFFIGRGRRSQH